MFRWVVLVLLLAGSRSAEPESYQPRGKPRVPEESLTAPDTSLAEGADALRNFVEAWPMPESARAESVSLRSEVRDFYEATGYDLVWIREGRSTAQARALVAAFEQASRIGLKSQDYDGSRWVSRLLTRPSEPNRASSVEWAQMDLSMTLAAIRYVADRRRGRMNPNREQGDFEINSAFNLVNFLRQELVESSDITASLAKLDPPFPAYRRTLDALEFYSKLAREAEEAPFPVPAKTLKPGEEYAALPRLARFLRRLGNLPAERGTDEADSVYEGALVDAIKRFQARHGLEPDGLIGRRTFGALNTPLEHRVLQLQLALERWRWLPREFVRPPIMVNVPEFSLYAYNQRLEPAISMNVVVGRAYKHKTPEFASGLKYVIFRPSWTVPWSIQSKELLPQIAKDRGYLLKENFEVIDRQGTVVSEGEVNDLILKKLRSGEFTLRQRPGPANSLGLVKFVFPNDHDVYLHGTPAMSLFSQSRRDFSHGCIRLQEPAALAAWVLQEKPEWTAERIRSAMNGTATVRASLDSPIPVWIVYTTAAVTEDGEVRFFDDIYGQDGPLAESLSGLYNHSELLPQ